MTGAGAGALALRALALLGVGLGDRAQALDGHHRPPPRRWCLPPASRRLPPQPHPLLLLPPPPLGAPRTCPAMSWRFGCLRGQVRRFVNLLACLLACVLQRQPFSTSCCCPRPTTSLVSGGGPAFLAPLCAVSATHVHARRHALTRGAPNCRRHPFVTFRGAGLRAFSRQQRGAYSRLRTAVMAACSRAQSGRSTASSRRLCLSISKSLFYTWRLRAPRWRCSAACPAAVPATHS